MTAKKRKETYEEKRQIL